MKIHLQFLLRRLCSGDQKCTVDWEKSLMHESLQRTYTENIKRIPNSELKKGRYNYESGKKHMKRYNQRIYRWKV